MIAGVLLAAGQATRFGSHKLLHPLADGTPLLLAALRKLRSAVDHVVVVIRPGDTQVFELLRQEMVLIVSCDQAQRGMGASLACGVRATSDAGGWLIALGDMPDVPVDVIDALATQLRNGAHIVAPSYDGQRGHPVGFDRSFFDELTQLDGDRGARWLIERHRHQLSLLACSDQGILFDIDTPNDLNVRFSR